MTHIPDHLQYTAEHEWADGPDGDGIVTFGITDFAQDALGDIVYVSLPAVDAQVVAGEPCGEVESTKSVSELYAPVSGVVTELLNSDPYGDGWMVRVRVADRAQPTGLLGAAAYGDLTVS